MQFRISPLSAASATLSPVEVRESDVDGIPAANIRVPRREFVAVWRTASTRAEEQGAQGATDWYAVAVAVTCRWLATAPKRPRTAPPPQTRSPPPNRPRVAKQEFIDAQ